MPRAVPVRSTRIAETICEKIDLLQSEYSSPSFNHMAELLLTQMIELVNAKPEERTLPAVCAALDAIRARRPLLKSPNSTVDQAANAILKQAAAAVKGAKR